MNLAAAPISFIGESYHQDNSSERHDCLLRLISLADFEMIMHIP